MSGQPVVADGRCFLAPSQASWSPSSAVSGCALWAFEAGAGVRTALVLGKLGNGSVSLFFGDLGGTVYAIDPDTGVERWRLLADGHPRTRITGAHLSQRSAAVRCLRSKRLPAACRITNAVRFVAVLGVDAVTGGGMEAVHHR